MNSKEVLEYLRTCKFCKIVMGTDYENDDRYFTLYDVFSDEIEIIQKDLDRLEELEKENERLKKDLEVLEILKREMFNKNQCFDLDECWYDDSFSFSKDEQKKIKEWLINE